METTVEQPEPTVEELKEMRKKMDDYYEEQFPFLEKQLKYEELLTSIEVSRYRRLEAMIRIAQIEQGPQSEKPKENPERKLKQDKE